MKLEISDRNKLSRFTQAASSTKRRYELLPSLSTLAPPIIYQSLHPVLLMLTLRSVPIVSDPKCSAGSQP
jgi:hypothetical protein